MDISAERVEICVIIAGKGLAEEMDEPGMTFPRYHGILRKIRIVSNNEGFGPRPEPDEEVEQHLTITDKGRVWLSRYCFGHFCGENGWVKKTSFHISKENAKTILAAVQDYFSGNHTNYFVTDVGSWDLELTNTEGKVFRESGSLCGDLSTPHGGLSDIIRDQTDHQELFVFDGNPERVDKVEIEYHRVTKIKPKERPSDAKWEYVTWNYSEKLSMDRKSESLLHVQRIRAGCTVTKAYYVDGGISSLLDDLYMDSFDDIVGNPPDTAENPMGAKDYKITVTSKLGDVREITGTFDKNGLPTVWPDFIEDVYKFITLYGIGELFDEKIYGKTRRRQSELIFCNVIFEEGGKTYCYLADTDDYEKGELVIVPAGEDNHEAVVRIESIEYHTADDAPFPIEKAKHILRKYSESN